MPNKLHPKVVRKLHEVLPAIAKMKALSWQYVWCSCLDKIKRR